MATFGNIGGAEPSTITFKAATVVVARGTTNEMQEILCLGDPVSSLALAAVSNAPMAGNTYGVGVRIVSGPSSVADLAVRAVLSSTSADNPVTVSGTVSIQGNSTVVQGTNPWTIAGNSTVVQGTNPWTIAGNSTVIQGTSPWIVGITGPTSTAAPAATDTGVVVRQVGYVAPSTTVSVANTVTIQGNSTVIVSGAVTIQGNSTVVVASGNSSVIITSGNSSVIVTSGNIAISGNSTVLQGTSPWVVAEVMQSSVAPSSGSSGVIVRPVIDLILTTASSNAFATSTSLTVQSSGASLRSYVTAFSVTCTNAVATRIGFYSSGTLLWPFVLQALSSAIAGVNLAVSAPAYLFRTNAAEALTLQMGGSSGAGFKAAVSYFRAP